MAGGLARLFGQRQSRFGISAPTPERAQYYPNNTAGSQVANCGTV